MILFQSAQKIESAIRGHKDLRLKDISMMTEYRNVLTKRLPEYRNVLTKDLKDKSNMLIICHNEELFLYSSIILNNSVIPAQMNQSTTCTTCTCRKVAFSSK